MKRLDEMDFNEISIEYGSIFSFVDSNILTDIKTDIDLIYNEYITNIKKGLKIKGGTLGRGELKWGRNIIWGWYIEKIVYEIFKQNQHLSNVNFYGGDLSHKFIYDLTNKTITIEGAKETKPDFLLTINNIDFCIELKTAAKGVFSIKKGNIEQLYKEAGYNNRITLILMIDLENTTYSIENLKYFYNLKPFVNQRMEGQLCYNFPAPDKQLKDLLAVNFQEYFDNDIFNLLEIKKIRALKIAEDTNNKIYIDLIKNKIKLDKIIEEKNYNIELFDNQINKLLSKYNNLDKISWQDIFKKLNICNMEQCKNNV